MDAKATKVCLFASVDADGWIGYNNCLPVELKERGQSDVLRAAVRGKTVIIGRKSAVATFQGRPPGKHVIVMTRSPHKRLFNAWEDVLYASTPLEALSKCPKPEVVVLGGARTFWSFLPFASELRICALAGRVRRPDTLRSIAGAQWAENVPASAVVEQSDGFRILTWFVEQPARQPVDEPSKPYWERAQPEVHHHHRTRIDRPPVDTKITNTEEDDAMLIANEESKRELNKAEEADIELARIRNNYDAFLARGELAQRKKECLEDDGLYNSDASDYYNEEEEEEEASVEQSATNLVSS